MPPAGNGTVPVLAAICASVCSPFPGPEDQAASAKRTKLTRNRCGRFMHNRCRIGANCGICVDQAVVAALNARMILVARDEEDRATVTGRCLPVAGNLAAIIDADRPQCRKVGLIRQKRAKITHRSPVLPQECTLTTTVLSPIANNLPAVVNGICIGTVVDGPEVVHCSIPEKRMKVRVFEFGSSDHLPEIVDH